METIDTTSAQEARIMGLLDLDKTVHEIGLAKVLDLLSSICESNAERVRRQPTRRTRIANHCRHTERVGIESQWDYAAKVIHDLSMQHQFKL